MSAGKARQIWKDIPVVGDLCHLLLADVFRFSTLGLDCCSPLNFPERTAQPVGCEVHRFLSADHMALSSLEMVVSAQPLCADSFPGHRLALR